MSYEVPKISIVIPTFNAADTLEKSIQSLLMQDYPNLELILMDGGSQDQTIAIAKQYADHFSHIISEKDKGQANALNKGFRLATGEIWGWLCADDELLPGALQHSIELFHAHPSTTCVTGGCRRIFWDGSVIETTPDPLLVERLGYRNGVEQPSTLWKATLHKSAGELDESLNYAFDWEWWNRLKAKGAVITLTDKLMSNYYFSETNKTSTGGTAIAQDMYRVIKRYGPRRGYLADAYMFLYRAFDLHGCYDHPPTCSTTRQRAWRFSLEVLIKLFEADPIICYNWNFASKQARGLCWFK
ncbi:MAG: glycosyltransferase family 2 protein [Leptolyngbyaceae cyanobacterium bins.349]|nr:glycosyltransferase family 2 protein [Leptolyngbyaceae cyanobacterium bins.349]